MLHVLLGMSPLVGKAGSGVEAPQILNLAKISIACVLETSTNNNTQKHVLISFVYSLLQLSVICVHIYIYIYDMCVHIYIYIYIFAPNLLLTGIATKLIFGRSCLDN